MKGWQIFWQSVLRVFNNLGVALRISVVPYIIIVAVSAVLLFPVLGVIMDPEAMTATIRSGTFPWISFLIVALVGLIGTLWIAVAWHRYILLDEVPTIIPAFHAGRIGAYFLRGLLIGLILVVIGFVLGLVASLIASPLMHPGVSLVMILVGSLIFALIVFVPLVIIGMRLSTSLPAAALGTPKGIGDAWRSTAGQLGPFVVLAIILAVASFLSNYVSNFLLGNSVLLLAWSIVVGWISSMVGVSILTTLYGHYVEGRPLT
jgi:hypothetical protein